MGRSLIGLQLVTPEGEATPEFAREWHEARGAIPLTAGAALVDGEGKPTTEFLSLWQASWGGGQVRSINPETVMFAPDGQFTPIGYARWLAAVAP